MKKKLVIISVMILVLGIIIGKEVLLKNDILNEEGNVVTENYQKERKLYVSNVPVIDQEYTLNVTNVKDEVIKETGLDDLTTEENIISVGYENKMEDEIIKEENAESSVSKKDELKKRIIMLKI